MMGEPMKPDEVFKVGRYMWLRVDGVERSYVDWEKRLGLAPGSMSKRIHLGWPLDKCVQPKVEPKSGKRKKPAPVVIPPRESEQMSSFRHGAWV